MFQSISRSETIDTSHGWLFFFRHHWYDNYTCYYTRRWSTNETNDWFFTCFNLWMVYDFLMKKLVNNFVFLIFSRIVTFEWLKCSARVGEWLGVNKFEPKRFYQTHSSLNIYRKSRQQQKPIHLFKDCGLIYLTSIAKHRSLLLRLLSLLGGNVIIFKSSILRSTFHVF